MHDGQTRTLVREAPGDGELAPVLVSFGGAEPQPRGTVAIRLLLAIPHVIALWVLGIAAGIVALIGWLAALATGRLPGFAAEFLTGYLRWQTRVHAYVTLLTGKYPPLTLGEAEYPVQVAVSPGPLNRLAVLLRIILAIPAVVVSAVLGYGAYTVVLFITWLIVLITGSMPEPLYQALAATLRYQARLYGYWFMLTSAYPGGLMGDTPGAGTSAQARRASAANPWTLVLSGLAKRLVGAFIVLGVIFAATGGGVYAANRPATPANALAATNNAVGVAYDQLTAAESADKACNEKVSCQAPLNAQMSSTFSTLADQLSAIHMPTAITQNDATRAAEDARTLARDFGSASKATSETQYTNLAINVNNGMGVLSSDLKSLQSDLQLAGAS